ncbi:MAG: putative Ig domain-containing protein [Pirellulales bacterium]
MGGMLLDSTTGKIYWAPMPEQVGRSNVVLTATDGRGGATEQGFAVTVTAPVAVAAPVFTSSPVTAFGADQIYRYQPNVQSEVAGSLRYSLVESPVGMTIDPGTGAIQWDSRSTGLKLVDNLNGFTGPIQNSNFGQFEIPDAPNFHSASVTVEGWFNFSDPRAAVFEPLLAKEATTSRNDTSWGLEYFYGTIRARIGRADGSVLALVTAPAPVTFEKWTHLAMTFDDSTKTLTLFVDGQAVASAVSPEAIGYSDKPVYSGANMMVATRLRVWNYARSATEIAANQLAQVPSNTSGLVLDLGMNESADAVTLLDSSSAKNNGTLLGVPDFFRFPKRIPTLADSGSRSVRIRVEDGRGGFADQSFTVTSQLPYTTNVSGFVYDDLNPNGKWDHRLGENLVLNGDFSSRNQAFESEFLVREQSGGGWMTDGQATVSNSSSAVPLTGDNQGHTYGNASDLMLVANGGATDKVVWRQSIATQSGTNYSFSYWAMRPNNYDAARLQVRLNGQSFGTILNTADVGPATYLQFKSDFFATSDLSTFEIVLLGNLTAPNPGLLSAENAVAIDDVLLVESGARRAIVSGKANPYLAGMPNGSTALGSIAPAGSPSSVSVTSGEVLRFSATGQVLSQGFIMGPSADGRADNINLGALNGLSGLQLPVTGALVGVFLSDESPANQSAPATLDFRNGGNVPGGVNYQSLAPALRQLFFIGDGKNDQGVEQTITVPAGATRLMLASGASSSWDNSRGTFDVQILTGVSEPAQSGRVIYVDSNFNNRWDAGETTATTNARGLYTIASPGASARFGLVQKVGSVQAFPSTPFQVSGTPTSAAMEWATHDVPSAAGPRFLTQPAANAGIVDLSAPTVFMFQAFAQAGDGEPVSYSLASAPTEMFIDRVSGLLRWSPRATDAGEHDVMIKAVDSAGRFAMQRFTLRVTANSSPIIVSTPHTNAIRQVPYEYRLRAQDAEQSSLRYELITAPVGMTIDADTGTVRWTPDAIGTNNVVVRVSDRA